jgi:hypothetical protein
MLRFRRKRVIKVREEVPRGVVRPTQTVARPVVTPTQARLILLAAVLIAVAWSAWWLYRSPWLTVQDVTVTGTANLSESEVRRAAGIDGRSSFGLDLRAAQERVKGLPGVRDAHVRLESRSHVSIAVEERIPWGSWQIGDVLTPIDTDGYVLDHPAPEGSPVIFEADPKGVINPGDRLDPGAVEVAARLAREAEKTLGMTVGRFIYRDDLGLVVVFVGGERGPIWATFGDSRDYEYKVASLYVLIEQAKEEDLGLKTVDLRFGDRLSFHN